MGLRALRALRVLGGFVLASGSITLLSASGCGSGSNDPLMPISLFPQAYAQALCASLQHCCAENQVAFADPECTAGWKDTVGKLAANPVLAGNYDSKVATDCINRVSGAKTAACEPAIGTISDARDVCQRVFAGKKPTNALCNDSAECAPVPGLIVGCEGLPIPDPDAGLLPLDGRFVTPLPVGVGPRALPTVRKCVALEPPQAGDSCSTPELQSLCERDPNQFCDLSDKLCKSRGDVGGLCKPNGCKVGLFCSAEACVPGGLVGEACATAVECNTFLRCDPGGRCADRLRPQESCTKDEECSIGVCDLGTRRCLRNAIATSESCRGSDPLTARRP